ncbi:HWE histidine kinase domain-containing protein [uncultured Ferrovibrio sp.]|uniref:sensor histidine kinase n=1 Tax=uncultured Ferrovibrio sp. TaxID=1576913 RepID=UPI002601D4EE|nr:HWE histidine kinase domain-containing protein [uncultured Ferrovibrio sp.]
MSEVEMSRPHLAFAKQFDGSEAVLKTPPRFVDMLPIAVYACDADGRICWFNRHAVQIWGRIPQLEDGQTRFGGAHKLYEIDGSELPPDEAPMAQVLRTGQPLRGKELIVERPDGSRSIVLAFIDPVEDAGGNVVGAINCFHDASRHRQAEDDLRERERWFRELLESLPAAVYTTDAEGRITFYNAAAKVFWGVTPVIGESRWCGSWRIYRPDGEALPHDQCPMAVAIRERRAIRGEEAITERPDGTRVPFIAYPTPLFDADGTITGAVNMLVDISERKQAEERKKVLIDELNHRVKNTLATVQSLAVQTFRGVGLPSEACRIFDGRLFALSKAHTLLTFSGWTNADLKTLIENILEPYSNSGNSIRLAGMPVRLTPRAAPLFAMILHELATNAAKYGALSAETGAIDIEWTTRESETGHMLQAVWQESGGPEVRPPHRRGFGSRLIERGVAAELKGDAVIAYEPSGLRCTINIPLAATPAAENH